MRGGTTNGGATQGAECVEITGLIVAHFLKPFL